MNNKDVIAIAMEQSAIDSNCKPTDFLKKENVVVISDINEKARKYLHLPFYCDLSSYGNNIVASVNSEVVDVVKNYIDKFPCEYCLSLIHI